MSSRQSTHTDTDLLWKGFNFSSFSKKLPNKHIMAIIEDEIKDFKKEEANKICAKISLTRMSIKLWKN